MRAVFLAALLLAGCGGSELQTKAGAGECTAPITIKAADYTTDIQGEWLWMPDINSEVRLMESCT